MASTRPTILISSTIYDFRDLRSALKYWLTSIGFDVLLSEYNDFVKPLAENSYEACIRAIGSSQYVILLVGGRVGGLYDARERISITRQEYREARKRFEAGQLKVIAFVRKELWDIREDRSALHRILQEGLAAEQELSADAIAKIANHSSKLVNDADMVFSFLEEIGQVQQMKDAVAGRGTFPKGNWIHTFSTFEDIVDRVL